MRAPSASRIAWQPEMVRHSALGGFLCQKGGEVDGDGTVTRLRSRLGGRRGDRTLPATGRVHVLTTPSDFRPKGSRGSLSTAASLRVPSRAASFRCNWTCLRSSEARSISSGLLKSATAGSCGCSRPRSTCKTARSLASSSSPPDFIESVGQVRGRSRAGDSGTCRKRRSIHRTWFRYRERRGSPVGWLMGVGAGRNRLLDLRISSIDQIVDASWADRK